MGKSIAPSTCLIRLPRENRLDDDEQGMTEFATANVTDFEGLGFRRAWNPFGG